MTERADQGPGDLRADYAHILDDLHGLARQVAGLVAVVEEIRDGLLNPMYGQLSEIRREVDELAPAARRAAAMLDNPVSAWVDMRRKADTNGRDQRAGTRAGRGRRARAAGRQLSHA